MKTPQIALEVYGLGSSAIIENLKDGLEGGDVDDMERALTNLKTLAKFGLHLIKRFDPTEDDDFRDDYCNTSLYRNTRPSVLQQTLESLTTKKKIVKEDDEEEE